MHQNDKDTEITKTIVAFNTLLDSASRLSGGTGTYEDFVIVASCLKFCEDKLEVNPRLGFSKEIKDVRVTLSNLLDKISTGKILTIDDWISPFVTQIEQRDIENLIFLVKNQFVGAPVLDTEKSVDEHIEIAFNKERRYQ